MNGKSTGRPAMLLAAIALLSIAAMALATEQDAQPAVEPDQNPAAAQPATSKENADAVKKGGAKKDAAEPQPADATKKTEAAKGEKKPLIVPPGLLSQAPVVPPSTAPGLGKLDLNRATLEQLQRLPGVGLTWAPRILAGRPYRTLGDLARDGIPFTTVEALSHEVELGP